MCPICLSTIGWIAIGGGAGSGTLAALLVALKLRNPKEQNDGRSPDCE
jgi:hypothetical protein